MATHSDGLTARRLGLFLDGQMLVRPASGWSLGVYANVGLIPLYKYYKLNNIFLTFNRVHSRIVLQKCA